MVVLLRGARGALFADFCDGVCIHGGVGGVGVRLGGVHGTYQVMGRKVAPHIIAFHHDISETETLVVV